MIRNHLTKCFVRHGKLRCLQLLFYDVPFGAKAANDMIPVWPPRKEKPNSNVFFPKIQTGWWKKGLLLV